MKQRLKRKFGKVKRYTISNNADTAGHERLPQKPSQLRLVGEGLIFAISRTLSVKWSFLPKDSTNDYTTPTSHMLEYRGRVGLIL